MAENVIGVATRIVGADSRSLKVWRVAPVPRIWGPGYRYDAIDDFNPSSRYIYDAAARLSSQRSVRPWIHFTGKERDTESGNDYFGARYYSSAMGRFMSPDWSAKEEPVPYAKLDDPQTLNLYGYLRNNPLGGVDADGHCGGGPNDPPCPSLSKEDKAAVKDAVDSSNKATADDKKGKNHEEAVMTGKDANGNHAIVPAKPGAYSDVTKPGGKATVQPDVPADPSKKGTIVTPEVQAHVHPAGTATTDSTNSAGQTVETTHFWVQTPSQPDRDAALPAPGINLVVGAGSTGNASGSPTVYFYTSSGTTCTESYKDFLK